MGNCNREPFGHSIRTCPKKHLVYLEVGTQIFKSFDCTLIPTKFIVRGGGGGLGFRV
jgi:hypothetical protein